MDSEHSKDSPNVIRFPPLVFVAAIVTGLFLNWLVPFQVRIGTPGQVAGGMVSFAGIAFGLWGVRALRNSGTSVRPDRPVTALVMTGPFRYTRNPLYLAMTATTLGIAVSSGIVWLLITLVPALAVVHWRIVRREEHFMEAKFGDAYRAYKSRVRRWV